MCLFKNVKHDLITQNQQFNVSELMSSSSIILSTIFSSSSKFSCIPFGIIFLNDFFSVIVKTKFRMLNACFCISFLSCSAKELHNFMILTPKGMYLNKGVRSSIKSEICERSPYPALRITSKRT